MIDINLILTFDLFSIIFNELLIKYEQNITVRRQHCFPLYYLLHFYDFFAYCTCTVILYLQFLSLSFSSFGKTTIFIISIMVFSRCC